MIDNGKNYIVEARIAWIDHTQYDYVYGKCTTHKMEEKLGFPLKNGGEEWYIKVAGEKGEVVIQGYRIGTCIQTDAPFLDKPTPEEYKHNYDLRPAKILIL
jgi:hypothetical protein